MAMDDIIEWVALLIYGVIGIGVAIAISQAFCNAIPATCSYFPPIIGAAILGLIIGLKFWLSKER